VEERRQEMNLVKLEEAGRESGVYGARADVGRIGLHVVTTTEEAPFL
jgi:hypothetical protein